MRATDTMLLEIIDGTQKETSSSFFLVVNPIISMN